MFQNKIFTGDVYHKRHTPFEHDYKYRVYTLWVDVDDLDHSRAAPKYFSFNRWNLLSLTLNNHGPRDGTKIRPWIEAAALKKNIDITDGRIFMLCFPRVLGFVFNPLTLYFCYDRNNKLTALLYQVKNTFGEQHGYLLPVKQEKIIKQNTAKVFHVSPFIQIDSHYNFRVIAPHSDGFHVAIHQTVSDNEKILTATWDGGQAMDFTPSNLLKVFWKIPLLSFKIIFAIHWQALKLWVKGAKFRTSPPLPKDDVT